MDYLTEIGKYVENPRDFIEYTSTAFSRMINLWDISVNGAKKFLSEELEASTYGETLPKSIIDFLVPMAWMAYEGGYRA